MKRTETTRRNLLQSAAGTLGLAVAGRWVSKTARAAESTAAASGTLPAVRLGGPVFRAPADPEGLALAHKKLGYRAAYCPGMSLNDRERIRDTTAAFQKHGVILAEVGRWVNLLDHDSRQRAANLNLVTEGLALAEALQRGAAWILPDLTVPRPGSGRIPTIFRRRSSMRRWRTPARSSTR